MAATLNLRRERIGFIIARNLVFEECQGGPLAAPSI